MHERVKEVENKRFATRMAEVEPSRPDSGQREKNNLNFYFHASLWCLKRFYEGLILLQLSKTRVQQKLISSIKIFFCTIK